MVADLRREEIARPPDHEHYWIDAPDDEAGWFCTICRVTEHPYEGIHEDDVLDAARTPEQALNDAIEGQNLYHGRHGTVPAGRATALAILGGLRNRGFTVTPLVASPSPDTDAGLDRERLIEAMWNANSEGLWGEAIDTITVMADQVLTEYARLATPDKDQPV